MDDPTPILNRLAHCLRHGTYESLETDWLEIKPMPPSKGARDSIRQSVCAFLNTRGGVVILGVKDEQLPHRHFRFTGYTEDNSAQVRALRTAFQDYQRHPLEVNDSQRFEVMPFHEGQIAIIRVVALPEHRKFCFYREVAYERVLDGDQKIPLNKVLEQEERKREMETYRELCPVEGMSLSDLSLQRINELIWLINQGQAMPIETIKDSVEKAVPFLVSKRFMLKDNQITIKPRISLAIRNPGHLPHELILEQPDHPIPVRRIFANPLARNPRLAEILKLHNKFEGKGIGMSELVNSALGNQIDLPYYLFHSANELSLVIPAGQVLYEASEAWLELLEGFLTGKSGGQPLTHEQRNVLAYLLKSERANRQRLYTLALTLGNNHFAAISQLKSWGLIQLHPASEPFREVYITARELATEAYPSELNNLFGLDFRGLDAINQNTLNMILLAEKYSREGGLNAKQVMWLVKSRLPEEYQKRWEDEFYRAIRYRIERLAPDKKDQELPPDTEWHSQPNRMLSRRGPASRPMYRLNRNYQRSL